MESMPVVKQSPFAISFALRSLAPASGWLEGTAVPMCSTQELGGDHQRTYRRRYRPDSAPGT